jgi:hypothetical protein
MSRTRRAMKTLNHAKRLRPYTKARTRRLVELWDF